MSLGWRELIRTPSRFVPVTVAMTLLVVLLVVLGGFLDGLQLSATGSYRAQDGDELAFNASSGLQISRSVVTQDQRNAIDAAATGRLSQISTTAGPVDGSLDDLADVVLYGYELATDVLPPPPGDGAVVDTALAERFPIEVGDTLSIGPSSEPVTVTALVDDISQGSPTIWLSIDRWEPIARAASPTRTPPPGASQAVVVQGAATAIPDGVVVATVDEVIGALDVVQQQTSTFQGIIAVTFVVALLVVALFFALITLERREQHAVLKAIGASSRDLLAALSLQAVLISAVALVAGTALAVGLAALLPPELPVRLVPSRIVIIAIGVVLTALVGSLLTLRRISRIDPAEAIG